MPAELSPVGGLAAVREIAEAGLVGQHEQDVVVVVRAEHAGIPDEPPGVTAGASFPGPGEDLRERRIAGHGIRQLAGLLRVGATQLDRRRRAAAFAVGSIDVERARRAVGDAGGRIEAAEPVIPIQGSQGRRRA